MEKFESILILMVVIWLFGKIFRDLKLPVIFGELLGGFIVGPLVFNLVDPNSETIQILSELGIFFLMLHTGLEANPRELIKSGKKSVLIALFGILIPLIGGYLVSIAFGKTVEQSMFIAVALTPTAVAISVRLLKDYKIHKTSVGKITLSAAVLGDIISLIMFSIVLSMIQTGNINWFELMIFLLKICAFFIITLFLGLKTSKYIPKMLKEKGFTFTLIAALTLGIIAEVIGLHIVIGAFLAGLFIHEEIVEEKIYKKIEDRVFGLSYSFLGPIFFASLAFYVDLNSFKTDPWFLIAIFFTLIIGKMFGTFLAAFLQKIPFGKSAIIGCAMNSRGAVGLIIASIGMKEGIIDESIFSVLVILAFATTLVSVFSIKPLIKRVYQR